MPRQERMRLISEIEQERGSRLLVFFTGDRRGLETRIAYDALPFCLDHLTKIGHIPRLDLCLYSTGGITMAGYSLVNLIREFCDAFNVIVPFKALSCATLVALGADEVLMTKMGQLSPIDPSVQHPLGPQAQVSGAPPGITQLVPVNVEDVISYFQLAKKELGLADEESLDSIFNRISQVVHPLVLGAVYRSREQIGFLANNLLSSHGVSEVDARRIIQTLTTGRFSHEYIIGRREALEVVGLPVANISPELESMIVDLYREYDELLQLSVPYSPDVALGNLTEATREFIGALIESRDLTHVFRRIKQIRMVQPPGAPTPIPIERDIRAEWAEDNTV